ncbi:carboxylesterase/lipase family protein [Actinocrispum wychmicini]|nr:carboxylesterase family protein [Actinocrispum wychmicini]
MKKLLVTVALLTLIATPATANAAGHVDSLTDNAAGPHTVSRSHTVRTDSGPVRGTVTQDYASYQDIPFAAAPVGDLRWAPPQPPQPWSTPRDGTKPSPRCAQTAGGGTPSEQEDCLYLNVTTPNTHGRKPVMVWFHGGGNSYGAAADFDPHRLVVGGDVVVVTTNFRQGVFSAFASRDLPGCGDVRPCKQVSGDFGLQDQQAALRWVQRNAAAFGGDPHNVTIFGESGGAFDVCAQLTSPAANGLFHRAIMNSGSCSTNWPVNGIKHGSPAGSPWQSLAQAEAQGDALAAKFGCGTEAPPTKPSTTRDHPPAESDTTAARQPTESNGSNRPPAMSSAATGHPSAGAGTGVVDCLRRVPARDLVSGTDVTPITALAYNTPTLPEHPATALAEGRFHRVPVLTGNTRDEGRLTGAFAPAAVPYAQLLRDAFGSLGDSVATQYPVPSRLTWSAVLTDRVWTCNQLKDARELGKRTPVYHYEFADRTAPTGFFQFPPDVPGGAFHSTDLTYLFDYALFPAAFTADQQRLSDTMIRLWAGFARTGWMPDSLSFAPNDIHPVDLGAEHLCDFWWANLPAPVPAP